MFKKRFSLVLSGVFALLPGAQTAGAQALADCAPLPAGMQTHVVAGKPLAWQGDFNQDGLPDRAELVSLAAGFKPPQAMTLADPWEQQPVRLARKGTPIALLITQAAKAGACPRFLLASRFLDTPLWQAYVAGDPNQDAALRFIKAGTPAHKEWKKPLRALRGDALTLITEAGIDILLYWKKDHYEIFWPDEES